MILRRSEEKGFEGFFDFVTLYKKNLIMKHKRSKHGGKRSGSGRPHKWQGGPTKLVRIPISYVEQILRVVDYMDANEGRLPAGIAFHTEE